MKSRITTVTSGVTPAEGLRTTLSGGGGTHETLLTRGREAASNCEWEKAYALFSQTDAQGELSLADKAQFADIAYAAGHLDVTLEIWERVYEESRRAGNTFNAASAATRVAMHLLFDTALMAPVRGWIRRAEQYLNEQDESSVHAWLAVVRNYERLLSGDFQAARKWARRAIRLGVAHDEGAAAIGRIAEARSLIFDGEVQDGTDLLNEAALATIGGGLDPIAKGLVYCELICGLQAVAQYDLAEEWTREMEKWRHGNAVGSIHGRCRVHRAEILRLRGQTNEAETEALAALEELRPYLRRELGWPLTELGRIRLLKGDFDGAEQACLEAHRIGWDPQPWLARVYLARGESARAFASIRDAVESPRMVPSKERPPHTDLRLPPLLEAQVEIAIAAGDLELASEAAQKLSKIAERFASKPLQASASLSRARATLSAGDVAAACEEFESAVLLWTDVGAPYEAALARLGYARALQARGSRDRAALELGAAQRAFEEVGADYHAQEAASTEPATGESAPVRHEPPARTPSYSPASGADDALNVFRREGEYWSISCSGKTVRIRDLKGLRYLSRLLGYPGREFHVLDLVAVERGHSDDSALAPDENDAAISGKSAGAILDARAKQAYRRRLDEIEEDIEEARAMNDFQRDAQSTAEREILLQELSRAVGLGGRDRENGSNSERARVSVTRAVRLAMTRIREHDRELGEHLDRTIRTGTYCTYLPDPRSAANWAL